ncbi:MAG: hypothetical protein EOO61_14420 [Hymenobacter sp.]|nr:MAG: hypothetical protein EOO61_14420 [Hymenobacter sp.]
MKDLTAYQAVTKVLYDVPLVLASRKPIKSLPAYMLNQLKVLLPVYQPLGAAAGTLSKSVGSRAASVTLQA